MTHLKLYDVKSGTARVRAWAGSGSDEKRLADLGLHPGTRVEVVQHSGENGMLVAVNDDARIVVDPATASLVLVSLMEQMLPALAISQLSPGDRARIVGLSRSRLEYRQKLMSMGLTPGVEFQITRVAPLGDPVEIRVRGFAMSLRKTEADMVAVEKL